MFFFSHNFLHFILLYFSADGQRKVLHKFDYFWNFKMRNLKYNTGIKPLSLTPLSNLGL